jgi:hypothetical protein
VEFVELLVCVSQDGAHFEDHGEEGEGKCNLHREDLTVLFVLVNMKEANAYLNLM